MHICREATKKTLNLNPFDLSATPPLWKKKEKPCFGILNFRLLLPAAGQGSPPPADSLPFFCLTRSPLFEQTTNPRSPYQPSPSPSSSPPQPQRLPTMLPHLPLPIFDSRPNNPIAGFHRSAPFLGQPFLSSSLDLTNTSLSHRERRLVACRPSASPRPEPAASSCTDAIETHSLAVLWSYRRPPETEEKKRDLQRERSRYEKGEGREADLKTRRKT